MRIWFVGAAIVGAFVAALAIGAVMFLRPQGGLGYDRGELRQLREQTPFGLLLPTKLPAGFAYQQTVRVLGPAGDGVAMVFGHRDAHVAFVQWAVPPSPLTTEAGDPVPVAGTVGTYARRPWPVVAPEEGPTLAWTQDEGGYLLMAAGGPGRDDLLQIAASLKPLDDVLR